MDYVKIQFTHKGTMGFIENKDGAFVRHTDTEGNTITPEFDQILNLEPLEPKWAIEGSAYAYVSFVTGNLDAYQDTNGIAYNLDGSLLTDEYLRTNGFTENHLMDRFPSKPDWGV